MKHITPSHSTSHSNSNLNSNSHSHLRRTHIKQSRSDDLYQIAQLASHLWRTKHHRRNTDPTLDVCNTHRLNNNYYAQIRFDRSKRKRRDKRYHLNDTTLPFPDGNKIRDYTEFSKKYKFIMQNGNRKLLGYGAMCSVFKVYLTKNRNKKFAVKIASYRDPELRRAIINENRLLHKFGNGLEIFDIYDDKINHRMISFNHMVKI